MIFTDLYRHANGLTGAAVPVEALRTKVLEQHPVVGAVEFWGCELDPDVSFGHMILSLDRSSAYDDVYIVASIRFHRQLDLSWQRFVCCKELMHVFDDSLESTNNREKFLKLMDELENNPIPVNESAMFQSERNAEWQALLVLCPNRLREIYKPAYDSKKMSSEEVGHRLGIPAGLVRTLMSDQYIRALEVLTGESIANVTPGSAVPFAPKKRPDPR